MCLAPPNMHSVDGVACKSCPAGKEPHKNRTGCASCTTDGPSFMSANGAPCVQCAPGSQPNAARTSCVPCNTVHNDSFWYSNDGAECQRCNPGSASNAQRTSCVQCVGSFSAAGHQCLSCPGGSQPTTASSAINCTSCAQLGPKHISASGGACVECGDGKQRNSVMTTCEDCKVGTVSRGDVCQPCASGKQPNAERYACDACDSLNTPQLKYFKDSTMRACSPCWEHSLPSADSSACVCLNGFQPSADSSGKSSCIDIDECQAVNAYSANGTCTGNHSNLCNGFAELNMYKMTPGDHECGCCNKFSSGCTNHDGYFECSQCLSGFTGSSYGPNGCSLPVIAATAQPTNNSAGELQSAAPNAGFKLSVNSGADMDTVMAELAASMGIPVSDLQMAPVAPQGCNGVPLADGGHRLDTCGLCNGTNTTCADCFGVPLGVARMDLCGSCNEPNNSCVRDCAGTFGGNRTKDACDMCGGSQTHDSVCREAMTVAIKIPGTVAQLDTVAQSALRDAVSAQTGVLLRFVTIVKLVAVGTTKVELTFQLMVQKGMTASGRRHLQSNTLVNNLLAGIATSRNIARGAISSGTPSVAATDCLGIVAGSATLDVCGVCAGTGQTCRDCAGNVRGQATTDECGTCDANSTNNCIRDCTGRWGGGKALDRCGVCGGDGKSCAAALERSFTLRSSAGTSVAAALGALDQAVRSGALGFAPASQNIFAGLSMSCPVGFYVSSGGSCRRCTPGQEPNPTQTGCVPCRQRVNATHITWASLGGGACELCPAGKQQSDDNKLCVSCPVGQFSDGGGLACQLCPTGSYSALGSMKCMLCMAGKYDDDSTASTPCKECPAGLYSSGPGKTQCADCLSSHPGTTSVIGSSNCALCRVGYFNYKNSSSSHCTACNTIKVPMMPADVEALSQEAMLLPDICPGGLPGSAVILPRQGLWLHLQRDGTPELLSCESDESCLTATNISDMPARSFSGGKCAPAYTVREQQCQNSCLLQFYLAVA